MNVTSEQRENLKLMIEGLNALRIGSPAVQRGRSEEFTPLVQFRMMLAEDLAAFRLAAGIDDYWPEERKKLSDARQRLKADRKKQMDDLLPKFHELWGKIHRRALSYSAEKLSEELDWLNRILPSELPCGECKGHYENFLRQNPPVLQSADEYFAYTVKLHNYVNARNGNQVISVEDALLIWNGRND